MSNDIIRVGRLEKAYVKGDTFLRALSKVPELERMEIGYPDVWKYFHFDRNEHHLLVVSHNTRKRKLYKHNIMLTVTSDSKEVNLKAAENFEKITGLKFDMPVPRELREYFEMDRLHLKKTFELFEKDPWEARAYLERVHYSSYFN